MYLTDVAIRNAKAKERPYKLSVWIGLYLLIKKSGKYFRMNYRYAGKQKTLAFGVYPEVSLKEARARCDEARRLLRMGIDPMRNKMEIKAAREEMAANSFKDVALEWFLKKKSVWSPKYSRTVIRQLELHVFPWLGKRPVADIKAREVLAVLNRLEGRKTINTAHRVKRISGEVFGYAIATGRAERNPTTDLKGALTPAKSKRMPTITDPKKIGALLRDIDGYEGHPITKGALQFQASVFARPGEVRRAEWLEIDLQKAEWKIPAEKMKMGFSHIVPLSCQAITILEAISPLTGGGRYVFPSRGNSSKPISENTLPQALRRLGYTKDEMSVHGFRSMASTHLHEQGWPSDAIERQLSHMERNSVKAAYNYAQHLSVRQKMMQAWADYLDELRNNTRR